MQSHIKQPERILLGTSFTGIKENSDSGVTIEAIDNQTGKEIIIEGKHLIGCDGFHSKVREKAGIEM